LPIVWAGFFGLPLIGITIGPEKQKLFQRISQNYFRFTGLFTLGSFVFLIAENQWQSLMNFLLNGQIWILHIVAPSVFWVFAGYCFYTIWRDVVKGVKGEKYEVSQTGTTA
jgi:hypothetical protein